MSVERVYVVESVAEAFIDKVNEILSADRQAPAESVETP